MDANTGITRQQKGKRPSALSEGNDLIRAIDPWPSHILRHVSGTKTSPEKKSLRGQEHIMCQNQCFVGQLGNQIAQKLGKCSKMMPKGARRELPTQLTRTPYRFARCASKMPYYMEKRWGKKV